MDGYSKNRGTCVVLVCALLVCLCIVSPAEAQERTQTIRGSARDQSGSAVAGVTIQVVNTGTGEQRSTTTDTNGDYVVLNLPLGQFRLHAEREGFRSVEIKSIALSIGQVAEMDITLQVGTKTESVEVSAAPPIVETNNATLAGTVNETQLQSLPLNTRSFTAFTTIQPGVSTFYSAASSSNPTAAQQHQGSVISAQGQRPGFVAFIQDGMDISDGSSAGVPGTGGGDVLGVEGIAEFLVQTHNYNAEFGQAAGAVITYVTKSGTNDLHGSVYDYLRNDFFDARNFFDSAKKPPFRRNQFGATLAGPIKKERTFFFTNYEGLRQSLTTTGTYFVPSNTIQDAAAGTGIISDPNLLAGAGIGAADPFGLPLPGYDTENNTFTIASAAIPYIQLYPRPQFDINFNGLPTGVGQLSAANRQPITQNYFIGKVDHHFSEFDQFFVRYNYMDNDNSLNTESPVFSYLNKNRFQNVAIRETHIFSPAVINTFNFGFNRSKTIITLGENATVDPNLYFTPRGEFGVLTVSGSTGGFTAGGGALSRLGGDPNLDLEIFNNLFQVGDNLIWAKGAHSVKFGAVFKRYQLNDHGKPQFGFGGYTFFNYAAFLAADPQLFQVTANSTSRGRRQSMFGWFIQDDWKVTRRLTLNLGLRYEFNTMLSEVHGWLSNLASADAANMVIGNQPFPENYTLKQFQPRLGFAYDALGSSRLVLRGGAGIFYNHIPLENIRTEMDVNPPFDISNVWVEAVNPTPVSCGGPGPGLYLAFPHCPDGLLAPAAVVANPASATFLLSYGNPIHSPKAYQWNLGLETAVTSGLSLSLAYVGSHTIHLPELTEDSLVNSTTLSDGRVCFITPNSPLCPGPATPVLVNRTPGAIVFHTPYVGTSNYHALVFEVQKRMSHGIQLGGNYVWSHTIDISDDEFAGNVQIASAPTTNQLDIRNEVGNAAFDVRHRLVFNYAVELPFGHGRLVGKDATGWEQKVLGGWSLSGITLIQSGTPFTPQTGFNNAMSGNVLPWDRPDINPAFTGPIITGRADQWFNANAFIPATPGTQGNLGRNTFTTQGIVNFDFSLIKRTSLTERVNLEFAAQFFNLFNRTDLGLPQLSLASAASAGRVTSTTINARQVQFGLKLLF